MLSKQNHTQISYQCTPIEIHKGFEQSDMGYVRDRSDWKIIVTMTDNRDQGDVYQQ